MHLFCARERGSSPLDEVSACKIDCVIVGGAQGTTSSSILTTTTSETLGEQETSVIIPVLLEHYVIATVSYNIIIVRMSVTL